MPGRQAPTWLGPAAAMGTWRTHLAAASHAYWHTRRRLVGGGHFSPADLFQLLVTWAGTKLRI
eukprot:5269930-Alexandrium_andersonii.AAC.1